jgi:hypothetical protein
VSEHATRRPDGASQDLQIFFQDGHTLDFPPIDGKTKRMIANSMKVWAFFGAEGAANFPWFLRWRLQG